MPQAQLDHRGFNWPTTRRNGAFDPTDQLALQQDDPSARQARSIAPPEGLQRRPTVTNLTAAGAPRPSGSRRRVCRRGHPVALGCAIVTRPAPPRPSEQRGFDGSCHPNPGLFLGARLETAACQRSSVRRAAEARAQAPRPPASCALAQSREGSLVAATRPASRDGCSFFIHKIGEVPGPFRKDHVLLRTGVDATRRPAIRYPLRERTTSPGRPPLATSSRSHGDGAAHVYGVQPRPLPGKHHHHCDPLRCDDDVGSRQRALGRLAVAARGRSCVPGRAGVSMDGWMGVARAARDRAPRYISSRDAWRARSGWQVVHGKKAGQRKRNAHVTCRATSSCLTTTRLTTTPPLTTALTHYRYHPTTTPPPPQRATTPPALHRHRSTIQPLHIT